MTLEGEYYKKDFTCSRSEIFVAILMTLEGEYYAKCNFNGITLDESQSSWHWKANITLILTALRLTRSSRNPHDIGRRILRAAQLPCVNDKIVAILMTLEGEYYIKFCANCFNYRVAILMTLEGEYYYYTFLGHLLDFDVAILMTLEGEYYNTHLKNNEKKFLSQSSWHWKANITCHTWKRYIMGFVAILMTLEGEYYNNVSTFFRWQTCRNPHDIGRRILPQVQRRLWRIFRYGRNPHDIGRRILLHLNQSLP